jgi:POTRA domain, FtsQ-type
MRERDPFDEREKDESNASPESVFSQRSGIRDPLPCHGRGSQSDWGKLPGTESSMKNSHTDGFSGDAPTAGTLQVEDPTEQEDYYYTDEEIEQREYREHQKMLRQRRKRKKKQVLFNRLRLILKLCFAISLMIGLWQLMACPFWRYDKPLFSLQNNHLITPKQILPLLKPYLGKPLPLLDTARLSKSIQHQSPIVEYVAIRRELFPARLTIMVKEKMPWAQVSNGIIEPKPVYPELETTTHTARPPQTMPIPSLAKPYALLTQNEIISLSSATHMASYSPKLYPHHPIEPLILKPQTHYSKAYLNKLRSYIWKARHLAGLKLLWTDAQQPQHVKFHFQETDVILGRLNDSAEQRLLRILVVLPKLRELKEAVGAVDLQWEEQITFHTKPNMKLEAPKPPKTDG